MLVAAETSNLEEGTLLEAKMSLGRCKLTRKNDLGFFEHIFERWITMRKYNPRFEHVSDPQQYLDSLVKSVDLAMKIAAGDRTAKAKLNTLYKNVFLVDEDFASTWEYCVLKAIAEYDGRLSSNLAKLWKKIINDATAYVR